MLSSRSPGKCRYSTLRTSLLYLKFAIAKSCETVRNVGVVAFTWPTDQFQNKMKNDRVRPQAIRSYSKRATPALSCSRVCLTAGHRVVMTILGNKTNFCFISIASLVSRYFIFYTNPSGSQEKCDVLCLRGSAFLISLQD